MASPDFTAARWRRSSYSMQQGECVEVSPVGDVIGVRDSKHPAGPVLVFRRSAFGPLLQSLRNGAESA